MNTVTSKKGQIVLQSSKWEQLHRVPGQDFDVFIEDGDTILLRRISHSLNHVLIDHLLACPTHFEVPPRAKDSTPHLALRATL